MPDDTERTGGPRRTSDRGVDPPIPEGLTDAELPRDVRRELSGLGPDLSRRVGEHVAAAAQALAEDPELAYRHAVAARRRAARLPVVREMVGLAAYRTERYAEALAELRTVRRMTGSQTHLPVMADCERGLGRPDRALDLARSHEARLLDPSSRIELLIVEAGARLDLGDPQAAVAVLQIQELSAERVSPTLARLRYAYAEAVRAAGRDRDAGVWHLRARQSDPDGSAGLGSGFPADHDSDLDADEQLIDILDLESDPPEDA